MSIEAPASTPDPAATPVVVHFGKALEGKVKQVRVIIDNNPSPLVATMDLKPGLLVEEIDLRVRIDRFSSVRAIAETGDGKLEMASTWVNAAGGCSTPSSATEGGMRVLRRSYSYNDGANMTAERWPPWKQGMEFDAGLVFVCFQRDPRKGFIPIFEKMSRFE